MMVLPLPSSPSTAPEAPMPMAQIAPRTQEEAFSEEFSKLNHIYQTHLDHLMQQGVMLFSSATQRANYHKNRYSNVLAMEPTRVKLQRFMDCYLDTDYINANYINGEIPGSERAYISCQAPLSSTLLPFWLMIWEQNCPVIVMLTKLTEREKPKAIVYWPENVGEVRDFGAISVTLKKTKSVDAYLEMRTFEVSCDNVKRQIVQFHYVEWPDFGVPNSTSTIRELICLMDLYRMKGSSHGVNGPVIVHCSAGVGRTGTFIAVHICMEKMKYYNSLDQINIPRTVMLLRQARNGMVQTQEQYQYIYEVVKDARSELRERAQRVFAAPTSSLDTTSPTSVTSAPYPHFAAHHNATPHSGHKSLHRTHGGNSTTHVVTPIPTNNPFQSNTTQQSNITLPSITRSSSNNTQNVIFAIPTLPPPTNYSNIGLSLGLSMPGSPRRNSNNNSHKRNYPDTPTFCVTAATTDSLADSNSPSTSSTPMLNYSIGTISSPLSPLSPSGSSSRSRTGSGAMETGEHEVFFCLEKKRRLSFSTC